ncbi:MAG: hypothetical protein JNL34_01005, partial [Anaerolineae bacterium]|nr:hypothetical protein [Anaerolineae bacterium]
DPMTTVRGPDGAELLTGFDDAWSLEPGDSALWFDAPEGGAYEVVVAGENESAGDFLLQFNQAPAGSTALLPGGVAVPAPVSAANGPLRLQFAARSDCPTVLVITPDGGPDFRALVQVSDDSGALIAEFGAGPEEKRLTVEADSGQYVAEIIPLDGSADGQIVLTTACAAEQPACTAAPQAANALLPAVTPAGLLMVQPGGEMTYGDALQGDVGQSSPFLLYQFMAEEGDELAVQVTGVSFNFNPEIYLVSPSQQLIGLAKDSPGAFKANDAVLSLIASESGAYQAFVGSEDGQAGAFMVRLVGKAATDPIELPFEVPVVVEPEQLQGLDSPLLRYTFEAQPNCATMVALQGQGADALSLGSYVRRAQGDPVGRLRVSNVTGAALVVPAGSGGYEVLLAPPDEFSAIEPLTLTVSCQLESAICEAAAANVMSTPVELPPFTPAPTAVPQCGNGKCEGWENEYSCPGDCDICGNGVCGPFESYESCRIDCPFRPTATPEPVSTVVPQGTKVPVCGDSWCEADEAITCCGDCGTCPDPCGDGYCDKDAGENPETCRADCPVGQPG